MADRFDRFAGFRRDETPAGLIDLAARVDELEASTGDTGGGAITRPEVDATFNGGIPLFEQDENKARVTQAFFIPNTTQKLVIVMVQRSQATSEANYTNENRRVKTQLVDIDDEHRAAERVEGQFIKLLKYSTQYDIIKLVAVAADGSRIANPDPDPVFADYPGNILFTFTTPDKFGTPSSPNANHILLNRLDPTTVDVYDAEVERVMFCPTTESGAAQNFAAAGIDQVQMVTRLDGKTINPHPHVLTSEELTQIADGLSGRPSSASLSPPANRGFVILRDSRMIPGRSYNWTRNICWAAGQRNVSGGSGINFIAANFSTDPNDLLSLSLTINSSTEPNDPKAADIILNLTQPSTPVALRWVRLRLKIQGALDSTYKVVSSEAKTSLQFDEYNTAGVKAIPIDNSIRLKPNRNYTIECTIRVRGGGVRTFTQNFSTGASGDIEHDPGAPTLAAPSAPTVDERDGKIFVDCPTPSANVTTHLTWQVVMSTSSSAPAGPPTVGSEGVVKIKNAQNVSFRPKQKQDVDLYFYYRVRNQSSNLFTSWSTGTLLTPDGVSRPLEDSIGDGPAELPMGLERSATSGTGHNNSGGFGFFFLDTGASDQDDFYNGMVLHIPSESTDDRVRVVGDYVGSTRRCTVNLFTSAPSGAIAYEIHYGSERAANSGSGHTSTTFVLDSGADPTNDFYNGMFLYIPALASADRIRRITDYVGSTKTCTIDPAFGSTPSGAHGYMLFEGGIGYANSDQTGIATGVPLRVYYDSETGANVAEIIAPTGENAYSLEGARIQVAKKSNGKIKADDVVVTTITLVYRHTPPVSGYTPVFRVLFANRYRDGGSTGQSDFSYWVEGFANGSTDNYDPGVFPPLQMDFLDEDSFPFSRYPAY